MAGSTHQHEQRRGTGHRPQRGPHRLTGTPVAARTAVLRHERLHRHAGTAQHQHDGDDQPLHRAHCGECLGRDAAHEPHVGEVEYDLHGAVGHERQGERKHRTLIHVRVPGGIEALRRQHRRTTRCLRVRRSMATSCAINHFRTPLLRRDASHGNTQQEARRQRRAQAGRRGRLAPGKTARGLEAAEVAIALDDPAIADSPPW